MKNSNDPTGRTRDLPACKFSTSINSTTAFSKVWQLSLGILTDSGFTCDGAALLGDMMKDTLCICVFRRNSVFKVMVETYARIKIDLGIVNILVAEIETWPEHWHEHVTKLLLLQEKILERISTLTRRSETG